MSTRRVTRAKNATQHPGIPDITPKKKRRTAEEVAAERQSKLDAKEEKERTKRASIKRVAKYEKNQADQDVVTDATPRAALPKPKPIPSKRKAVVAPPATKKKVTPPSDAEMSDARAAPSVPRPRPKPIPRKQKVIVQTPAAEDNGFLSDAEMDDAAADSSAFNPDPTQHSGTVTSDIDADGSDSAMPSSPPRKKTKVSGKKAGKVTKSSVRDAIKAVQQTHMSGKSKAADRKKTAPHSTISLNSDDSNDSDDSDILVVDATPKKAPSKQPASVQQDDDAMVVDRPSTKASKKATSKKSAQSVPAARLNNDSDEPITSHPPGRQPPQWTMPILSEYDRGATPMAGAPGRVDKKGKGKEKQKKEKEGKGKADLADDKKISVSRQARSDEKRIPPSSKSDSTPNGKDFSTGINDWAASIPKNAKPTKATTSQPSIFKNSTSSRRLPPLTNASTRSSTNSVLTENVLISHAIPITQEPKEQDTLQLHDGLGGLSDEDETQGLEREAAVASPPKGKKRVSSSALVKDSPGKPPARQAERTKKPGNNDLPDGVEQKLWRRVFVSTYMQYVATLANPWEVPPKLACQKLQVIWDAIFPNISCTVTSTSTVYLITVQRVADSYRSFIGSAAIAIVIAYLESQDTLKHSDDNRVEFATYALDKLRFLYKKANGDDKSKFRGLYQGAFVVQTFGAHFTAINGARKIHGLLDKPEEDLNPAGGLALSCAAVERALTLIATRTITIEMVLAAKGKSIPLPKTLNHSTGKVSNRQTGFNDVTWGSSTRSYVKSIVKSLREEKFQAIITSAKEFSKKSHRSGNDRAVDDAVDDEDFDERAQLVDISESESGSEDSDGSDVE
ncbi:hypothetical protein DEU56DRAFT_920176 [Suillus clintonianus]|uniref:uncharacterized protein n=1 Tax=Suillus clintonianus TaxID=1904413 RepID=UPI001B86B612|nr:uncharacterized protein DEU56DRAFT_920176 [Suillus clintonianus]KAG2110497.1 hypothetical protein DEU56DRAFT_920176 [Suillus clintonianus]